MGSKPSPSDIINLKLILVSGKTAVFQFRPSTTALDVAKYVYENWPEDWGNEERGDRYEVLRLIYQGRFLHGNVTLGALRLQQEKITVMHLVLRENLLEPSNGDPKRKHKHDHQANDPTENIISPHRSDATSPNSTTTSGCCGGCVIF